MQSKNKPEPKKVPQGQSPKVQKGTKEDRIREMFEKDPEKAAQLLRQLFLKDK